jgi:tetratricopeptide (TPR) repeat protein
MRRGIIAFIFIFYFLISFQAKDRALDSLYNALKGSEHDTVASFIHYKIAVQLNKSGFVDSSFFHYKIALDLAKKNNSGRMTYYCSKEISNYYYDIGEFDSTIVYLSNIIKYAGNDNARLKEIYRNLGTSYYFKGNYIKAYEFYLKNLRLCEIESSPKYLSRAYSTVGVVLKEQKKGEDALAFFEKALSIAKKNNLAEETYVSLTNIGNIYVDRYHEGRSTYNINTSLNYYQQAKEIAVKLLDDPNNRSNAIILLGNIGNIYADLKQYDKALAEYNEALKLMEITEFFGSKSMIYNNLASVYVDIQKAKKAKKYIELANKAAIESDSPDDLMENYKMYSRLYELNDDYKKAYLFQLRYKKLSDSLFSTENAEKRKEIELNLEFEKKEATAKLELEKKEAIAKEERERQLLLRNAFIIGFILMLLVAFLIFRGYRQKQKSNEVITQQKLEVEKQKELVEEKQKEIIDSIKYAKRIQESLMPTDKYIDKNLNKLKDKK